MPRFKAINILTLLLPNQSERINKVKKLEVIPSDFHTLPLIYERTDRKYNGYLEAQDTVILIIKIEQHQTFY